MKIIVEVNDRKYNLWDENIEQINFRELELLSAIPSMEVVALLLFTFCRTNVALSQRVAQL